MIRFALKCDQEHSFESWFHSSAAFEALSAAGHVTCPACGSTQVDKTLMAPRVRPARSAAQTPADPPTAAPPLAPVSDQERAIAQMKAKVEAESEYVGASFANEARAIHDGDSPDRAIYGEAKPEEARQLIEDGVPVLPLPFTPTRKTN